MIRITRILIHDYQDYEHYLRDRQNWAVKKDTIFGKERIHGAVLIEEVVEDGELGTESRR